MAEKKKATKAKTESKAKTEPKKAPSAASAPVIDPALSAASAAAMVGHKVSMTTSADKGSSESSMFKQMKQSLNKPHSQLIGGALDKMTASGQKKSGAPFTGNRQVGHNQTFGSDATRRNVPRRTGGG